MRLNPDCVRDILLTAEERTDFSSGMLYPIDNGYPRLSNYTEDEVFYHIKQCEASGLIMDVNWFLGGSCLIGDLSPSGHEFLANIRSDKNWSKTKQIANKVGSYSLDALSKIAVNVVSSLIKGNF